MQYQFEGRLTARDCKRHIPHPFSLPANIHQITVRFRFTPHRVNEMNNMITLTVFDPSGWRGSGHRHGMEHVVQISAQAATPGYIPGQIKAGEWVVQLDTHMIMPGENVYYQLEVACVQEGLGEIVQARSTAGIQAAVSTKAGWYRGDLHSHTHHSDAGNRTVAELIQTARDYQLDFIFLSDHNTIAGLAEMDATASETLLTAGGLELTTFWGHALVLGTREWVDWRVRPGTGDMARIATEAYEAGHVYIIAHPLTIGDPLCTGCAWRYGEMMPGPARLVEIWNGVWEDYANNEKTLSLWYDWLNQGLRITATAGSDSHNAAKYATKPGFSIIQAEALTQSALLAGLRAGRVYLSRGPQLHFEAHNTQGHVFGIGDTVNQPATFVARWANAEPNAQLRVMANGRLLHQVAAADQGEFVWELRPDMADWLMIELRDGNGNMLAITNPIYLTLP